MDLENTPGLTIAERAAVAAYEEVYSVYAASVTDTLFDNESAEEEKAESLGRVVARVEEAYSRLSELAPPRTPAEREGWATVDYSLCSGVSRWGRGPLPSSTTRPCLGENFRRRGYSSSAVWT